MKIVKRPTGIYGLFLILYFKKQNLQTLMLIQFRLHRSFFFDELMQ